MKARAGDPLAPLEATIPEASVLRVLALYPDQMNIYADRGNLIFLRKRCQWRGIGFELTGCGNGETFDPGDHDLIYIGGGQDRDQEQVASDMIETKKDALATALATDAVILAVCGGYQLLGNSWATGSGSHPGLGILDFETVRTDEPRLIGPVAIEADFGDGPMTIAGFENHGGRTWLGDGVRPFGTLLAGHGNNGTDGQEGVACRNLIGTYLHGPLLPKNHRLADLLLERALVRSASGAIELVQLNDELEEAAHDSALRAAISGR